MSTVAEIKEAVTRLPERQKIQFARWMQTQVLEDAGDLELESALRHSLRSPLKKYKPGHFAALASRNHRRKSVM